MRNQLLRIFSLLLILFSSTSFSDRVLTLTFEEILLDQSNMTFPFVCRKHEVWLDRTTILASRSRIGVIKRTLLQRLLRQQMMSSLGND